MDLLGFLVLEAGLVLHLNLMHLVVEILSLPETLQILVVTVFEIHHFLVLVILQFGVARLVTLELVDLELVAVDLDTLLLMVVDHETL